jgi:hypothetical protein
VSTVERPRSKARAAWTALVSRRTCLAPRVGPRMADAPPPPNKSRPNRTPPNGSAPDRTKRAEPALAISLRCRTGRCPRSPCRPRYRDPAHPP